MVLGVPSNDFGAQEPRTEPEIAKFCETMYGVNFPLTAKQKVDRPRCPRALSVDRRHEAGEAAAPKWNFHKYLIGKDGSLKGAWPSRVRPGSQRDHRRDRRRLADAFHAAAACCLVRRAAIEPAHRE